jgi:hypothetical protein
MWTPRTLLITDPNLGESAHSRLSPICEDLTWICWDVGAPGGAAGLLSQIAGDRWSLVVSFYSDLILSVDALAAMDLPLNIHPALPWIRGVGHDVVPIVERHETAGPTMHRIEPPIDTGEIFDVLEVPLAPGHTYASLRALNQAHSLKMLDRLIALMVASSDLAELEARLSASAAAVPHRWGAYYSRKTVAALRAEHADVLGIDKAPQPA